MKKANRLISLMLALLMMLGVVCTFSSCDMQGPQGEKGDKGDTGPQGELGEKGEDGKDGISVSKTEINTNGELIITLSDGTVINLGNVTGTDGKNGVDGKDGTNGKDGTDGKNGMDGKDGINGKDGVDGNDGKDGISVSKTEINANGELVITLSDGTVTNLGNVTGTNGKDGADGKNGMDGKDGTNGKDGVDGKDGTDGKDGISVRKTEISANGELIITLSDGTVTNLGVVVGTNGEKGETGATGAQGEQGIQGVKGDSGKDAYEIYKEYFDYTGTREEWIQDLVNGNLAAKKTYTVTFDSDGGSEVTAQTVEYAAKATQPAAPTKAGYLFLGWYIGEEKWSFIGYSVTENITLTAKWKFDPTAVQPAVEFDILPISGGTLMKRYSTTDSIFNESTQDYRTHNGIDILSEAQASVYCVEDGVVGSVWYDSMYGYCVSVIHAGNVCSLYKNLSESIPSVITSGQPVKAGDLIGTVGDSAIYEVADPPHLHFEVMVDGERTDPLEYFSDASLELLQP